MTEELTILAIILGIIHSGIRLATPYLFASLGEMFSQRSGVLDLGVEGIMLMGAFFGFYAVYQNRQSLVRCGVSGRNRHLHGLVDVGREYHFPGRTGD